MPPHSFWFWGAHRKKLSNLLTLSFFLLSSHPMDKSNWIKQLKSLAEEKYNEGYGYQVYVECYTQGDWEKLIGDLKTWEEVLELFETIADIRTEECEVVQNEIF